MQISTALHQKADRLVEAGRVIHVKGFMYEVTGDTGTYHVHLSYPEEAVGACSCPSVMAVCSHIVAASIVYLADPPTIPDYIRDPFAGLN